MKGLLTGKIAKDIFKGFKGKLLKGELRREIPVASLDEFGDPQASTIQYFAIEGFTDRFSDFYRKKAGIPETDLNVAIFAQSSPGLVPAKDDKVTFKPKNTWYQLRTQNVDPADALFECRGFEISPPIDAS